MQNDITLANPMKRQAKAGSGRHNHITTSEHEEGMADAALVVVVVVVAHGKSAWRQDVHRSEPEEPKHRTRAAR